MKPRCKICDKEDKSISSILGKEFVDKLVYGLFNPESLPNDEEQKIDIRYFIQNHLDGLEENKEEITDEYLMSLTSLYLKDYCKKIMKIKNAKERAWKEIVEKLEKGELKPSNLSLKQMIEELKEVLVEELRKENLIELVVNEYLHRSLHEGYYVFTAEGQKIIAQKLLEEVFMNLEKYGLGLHEINMIGTGTYPSYMIREYDDFLHSYDNLDIQETLLTTALRDPVNMEILESDLKARIPLHKAKSSNAILIDKSSSMYGRKIKGAIMAALGLKELFETNYKEDTLHIIAFDYKPYLISSNEIIQLRANGSTDIGYALDFARKILAKEDGNKNIFLITDSEPTISHNPWQTPLQNALRASYLAGREEIRMNIIMLDNNPRLRDICDEMARMNGNSIITFIEDPLNLKEFIIKSFIDHKRRCSIFP
ncbi:MAG: VWA domain-containing protein [Nitrososphaerales archaeon]